MTSEITQAFEHPKQRSLATGAEGLDRISLRDYIVEVEIGAFQIERGVTQRISFNVVVEVYPSSGAETDDVDDILSYDRVTEAIEFEVAAERLNLLETLAERIADRILQEPQAARVFVRIEKLDRGVGSLGVEIVRSRSDDQVQTTSKAIQNALVVHIPRTAIGSEHLTGWIDQILDKGKPTVLTIGSTSADESATEADRRIALLDIEQNAWRLSAADNRCVVVNNWTEMDWGLKNAQLSVWAPSKMVIDSTDADVAQTSNPLDLSVWLAKQLGATHQILDLSATDGNGQGS